jgi:hypothetical protein
MSSVEEEGDEEEEWLLNVGERFRLGLDAAAAVSVPLSAAMRASHAAHVAISLARMDAKMSSPGTWAWHLRQEAVAKLPWHWIRREGQIPARPSRLSMFWV